MPNENKINSSFLNIKRAMKEVNNENRGDVKSNFGLHSLGRNFHDFAQQISITNRKLGLLVSQSIANKPKQYLHQEDPNKKIIKKLSDVDAILDLTYKFNKSQQQKKGINWLGLFGAALAAGGLIGFLLTGKTEFLSSLFKGLLKYNPLSMVLKRLHFELPKGIGTIFSKVFSKIGEIPMIAKSMGKIKGVFKPVVSVFEHIGEFVGKIGGIFGKGAGKAVVKEGAKLSAKTATKSVLKKIPGIGAIAGLIFGIQRFSKGDVLGGILEIASGAISMLSLTGLGAPAALAIGMGLDAFLLVRDIAKAGTPKPKEEKPFKPKKAAPAWLRKIWGIGAFMDVMDAFKYFSTGNINKGFRSLFTGAIGLFGGPLITPFADRIAYPIWDFFTFAAKSVSSFVVKVVKGTPDFISKGIEGAKKLPVIGSIIRMIEAMDNFTTDPLGSIKAVVGVANEFVPGLGDTLNQGVDWLVSLKDWEPIKRAKNFFNKGVKAVTNTASVAGKAITNAGTAAWSATSSFLNTETRDVIPDRQNYVMASPSSVVGNAGGTSFNRGGALNNVSKWSDYINEAAAKYNIDPKLLAAQMAQESNGNPYATSSVGAAGLMQFMPATAKDMGITDRFDPKQSVMGGAKYMSQLLKQFNGDETLALAAYNSGAGNVKGNLAHHNTPWASFNKETPDYVKKILENREQLKGEKYANLYTPYSKNNMPTSQVPYQIAANKSAIELSSGTIDQLAMSIGKQVQNTMPMPRTNNISINTTSARI